MMQSRFTTFFKLIRLLLIVIVLSSLFLVWWILAVNEFESKILQLFFAVIFTFTSLLFSYFFYSNLKTPAIKLKDNSIVLKTFLFSVAEYSYKDVVKIQYRVFAEETIQTAITSMRTPGPKFVPNHVAIGIVILRNGLTVSVSSDEYSNYRELLQYIEEKKSATNGQETILPVR